TWGDGVRIIGTPGGPSHFTSIAELAVYYSPANLVSDGGFEFQLGPGLSGLWKGEGPDPKGITRYERRGHSGVNNAWLKSGTGSWNAIVQTVPVQPHTAYLMTAWVHSNLTGPSGRFGVRSPGGASKIAEIAYGPAPGYTQLKLNFNSDAESIIDIYVGIWGNRTATGRERQSVRVDDISLFRITRSSKSGGTGTPR
ncbi:MAG: hypothetical protein ACRD4O_11760, partial [Bryobacteraceae bacterium]